jgi:hypothetical protein
MRNQILFIGAAIGMMASVEALASITNHEIIVIESPEMAMTADVLAPGVELIITPILSLEELILESASKVAIYSVPLPEENKIVLVRDPKDFVITAIRHGMEYLAIKPSEKGEFWELIPVFMDEASSLSFSLKKSEAAAEVSSEESEEEPMRIVAVKDFIRYN